MNIGLLGGTFDPIHLGHLALARAASEKYKLHRVLFVPANIPPHKQKQPVSDYYHRYTMVAMATAEEKTFFPSLLEAPTHTAISDRSGKGKSGESERPSYTIDTVRRLKETLGKSDRLFFLIGIDAFVDIAKWYEASALLKECEFIVASRPAIRWPMWRTRCRKRSGHRRRPPVLSRSRQRPGTWYCQGATIRLLDGVHQKVSSSAIREAAAGGKALSKLVNPAVADYIQKMKLYGKKR